MFTVVRDPLGGEGGKEGRRELVSSSPGHTTWRCVGALEMEAVVRRNEINHWNQWKNQGLVSQVVRGAQQSEVRAVEFLRLGSWRES
jgi:hypothetical protein